MNKLVAAVSIAALAASTFGQGLMNRPMNEKMLKATGGWVIKPGTQKGEIAYVNCQASAKKEWIQESIATFAKMTKLNLTLKEGKFDLKSPAVQGNLSIFIVEDADLPMSLIAPEAKWGLVNVAKLKSDKEPYFKARVKKELSRVAAMVCGGYKSSYPGNLTDSIVKVEDLDTRMNDALPVDVLGRFPAYLEPYGVTPAQVTTYRNACKQGWAATPTNDFQKAIWEEVNAIPDKPITIKKQK